MPPIPIQPIPFQQDGVQGFLHAGTGHGGMVLTHGAGGNAQAALLVAVATAFAAAGVSVLRCDLPFRQRRPRGPPSPAGAAEDRDGLRTAMAALRGIAEGPYYLGGQSYGGRQATMLAAEDTAVADALLLLSYPLHPPDQPSRLRIDHFPRLTLPCMFVHGSKDGFATSEELERAAALIAGPTRIMTIAGAGHDLKGGKFDLAAIPGALAALAKAGRA